MEQPSPSDRATASADDRSVLVSGGAGYIGSILTRQLLEDGWRVRVLDALFYGAASLLDVRDHPRFELIQGDTRDDACVTRALEGVDAVVHVAELVGDPACAVDPELTRAINLDATRRLAALARAGGVRRFVYPSSCSVYGASDSVVDEDSPLHPVSLYAETKIAAEEAIQALGDGRFEPVILRLATVFGRSPRPRFDLVVNLLTARAIADGEVTLFGGSQWRPFVHVADAAAAIRFCLTAPAEDVSGQIFNVGSDNLNYTIGEIADTVLDATPGARLREIADPDARNYRVSFARLRSLGFEPSTPIRTGIAEIQRALSTGEVTDYRAARHSNVQSLRADFGSFAYRQSSEENLQLAAG